MSTIEILYSEIVREGVARGYHVVPEFSVTTTKKLFIKKVDVAWLVPRDAPMKVGSLRKWKIAYAFEIEGADVPVSRIEMHSNQFGHIQEEEGKFPCLVALYTKATHRGDAWEVSHPSELLRQRADVAALSKNVVRVVLEDGLRSFLKTTKVINNQDGSRTHESQ